MEAVFVCRTNTLICLVLLTNKSVPPLTYTATAETRLGAAGWARVQSGEASANNSCSGWVGGHSNLTIQVFAPEKDSRISISYERVPSRVENWITWTFSSVRIRPPFRPTRHTMFIYPEEAKK
jgi:hypothetical protein